MVYLEYGVVALLAALGVAMSVIAFVHLARLVAEERQADWERQADVYSHALDDTIRQHATMANALAGLFSADRPATWADFHALAARLAGSARGLQGVAWLPRTGTAQRDALETAARGEGLIDYTIRPESRGPDQMGADAFPVLYVDPLPTNEAMLGIDMASLANARHALQHARDEGRIQATGSLELDQLPGAREIALFVPVYAGGGQIPVSLTERRSKLKGFVAVVLDVPELMGAAIKSGTAFADLYLFDELAPPGERLVYWRPAPQAGELRAPLGEAEVLGQPHAKRGINGGDRPWSLVLMPTSPGGAPLAAWASLVGGLLLTALLLAVSVGTISRRRRAEHWAAAIDRSNEGLWREIAERRLIEATLREAEKRLQMALKSAPLSLFAQDRELRYTWIYKSPMGLTEEEVLGRGDDEVLVPHDAEVLTPIKRRVLESGLGVRAEVQLQSRGRPVVLDLSIEPMFEPNGSIGGLIGTAIDVTREREVQTQLEHAQAEAERANEAKSRFLAAASHDLRQPLQATRLFLEVLNLRLKDHPARAVAEKAMTALEASDGLLNSLLDISTLEAGVVTPDITIFPLACVLDRLAAEAAPQAEAKQLSFRAVSCSLWVTSDTVLLERMVRNLIANALRYTRTGGILLGCRRVGRAVRIEVCDTGTGIPPDKLEVIFEDFVQLGNPERDRSRGLGLGLSVVQRTARLLHHRIGVRSVPNRGSAFWVELAIAPPVAVARRDELLLDVR